MECKADLKHFLKKIIFAQLINCRFEGEHITLYK